LKILLIHTYYRLRGGEDAVFEEECKLLEENGFIVRRLVFENRTGVTGFIQFLKSIWNWQAVRRLRREVKYFMPDIIHIHNWHFASGPVIAFEAKRLGIPVVATLHNYRLICPSGTLFHKGKIFTQSIHTNFPWKAVLHGVYRGSRLQTFWLALIVWAHGRRGTWNKIDRFIVLTKAVKDIFSSSKLKVPFDHFVIKPNFIPRSRVYLRNGARNSRFLFVGRLSIEKGIETLLKAFQDTSYELDIVGDGPLKELVVSQVKNSSNIRYLGNVDRNTVLQLMSQCSALVMPSIWYEPFGLVIVEAFSQKTPVIASNLGSMSVLIRHGYNGLHFNAGELQSLRHQIQYWSELSEVQKEAFYKNAISSYEERYSPEDNLKQLAKIYDSIFQVD